MVDDQIDTTTREFLATSGALPGFISINHPTATGGAQDYGSVFLSAAFLGTKFSVQDISQRNRCIARMRRGEANPYGINNAVNE